LNYIMSGADSERLAFIADKDAIEAQIGRACPSYHSAFAELGSSDCDAIGKITPITVKGNWASCVGCVFHEPFATTFEPSGK